MPTIRRCCIVGCLSNSRQSPQLQFFQFPKPENPFHKLWKQACHASLSRILPFKKPVVCALHFHPNCIGGRRLVSSAVPSLRLEVPSNLKAVEQQAMLEEIERSRKCAYINAVVYEWLVRANLNPQLRGSITHGMIKEKADAAKQIIRSNTFVADNRWLNRFRETHLTGFAQKLASNQLKPLGTSLWIPDIVNDLQHLFPPTSAERVADIENMPEQYIDYMQQYGEYDEDDDQEQDSSYQEPPETKSYHHQQQQQQHQQQQSQQSAQNHYSGYDAYGQQPNYNYDDFYYDRHNHHSNYTSPSPQQQLSRPSSHSPPQQLPQQQLQQQSPQTQQQPHSNRSSPYSFPAKRPKLQEDDEVQVLNGNHNETIEDLTDGPEENHKANIIGNALKNNKTNGNLTPNNSNSSSPKPMPINGQSNGHTTPVNVTKELDTYAQALEYLKPLEDFALFKENFRAIGLISQLEAILRKGDRVIATDLEE